MEYSECPNCGANMKSGLFNNPISKETDSIIIREFTDNISPAHCSKCVNPLLEKAISNGQLEFSEAQSTFEKLVLLIPILSIHQPLGWDYQSVGIVTGQTVTGTGVLSELSSSFSDFFGTQSGALTGKLSKGELLCMSQMRIKAVNMDCNAIIGADIDYSEVGSLKGMLMVCMTGTAVKLKNPKEMGYDDQAFVKIQTLSQRMNFIQELLPRLGVG